jgi:hypothetical protein
MRTILTKGQADRAVIDSLFVPGGTLACKRKIRWDMGKYQATIIGKELPEHINQLIWAERKTDKHGPYYALYCFE